MFQQKAKSEALHNEVKHEHMPAEALIKLLHHGFYELLCSFAYQIIFTISSLHMLNNLLRLGYEIV